MRPFPTYVVYSVVCMLSTRVSCAKRLNRSQCRLGSRLMVAQELYNLIYKIGVQIPRGRTILWGFAWDQIRLSAKVNAITKVGVWQRCGSLSNYFGHLLKLRVFHYARCKLAHISCKQSCDLTCITFIFDGLIWIKFNDAGS